MIGRIVPKGSAVRRDLEDHRKRLREALAACAPNETAVSDNQEAAKDVGSKVVAPPDAERSHSGEDGDAIDGGVQ